MERAMKGVMDVTKRGFPVLSGLLMLSTAASAATHVTKGPGHVAGEMVVKLKNSGVRAEAATLSLFQKALENTKVLKVESFKTDSSLQLVKIADDSKLRTAIASLSANENIEFAEPNFLYYALDAGMPNDPDFGKTWGIKNVGQPDSAGQVGKAGSDINIVPLWQRGLIGSRRITVAVIDTGIDWTHPDLVANLYTNSKEVAGDGVDNDGNGFVDDTHGWNFAAKSAASNDDHNHGSHCAGTIGGVGNNGVGVSGVAQEVTLMPVKFLDASGSGSLQAAVEAINYARLMKADIMSNSWGGGGYSETLKQAIMAAKDAGILFVAAAGNDSSDNDAGPTYPAGYQVENVLAVAATDNQDKIAGFSNYGKQSVHVAAPGVKVYSTVKGGGYDHFSGTSMATPHVAGIAAVLLASNAGWGYAEIKDRLIRTSDPVRGLKRKVLARGRVNASNAYVGYVPPSPEPDESRWVTQAHSVESEHPYANSIDTTYKVTVPGAKYVRIVFENVEVERNYDKVFVQTPSGEAVDELTGKLANYTSEYVEGDTAVIRFKSDSSQTGFGFKVAQIQVITGE